MTRSLVRSAATALTPAFAAAAPLVFSAAGANAASVQASVDSFRAVLGDPNNGTLAGSQPSGRREITWDGGGAGAPAATFSQPMLTFLNRGNVYTTPGTGFEISGQPNPEFGDINATYPDIFTTFSSPRLFAALGSNVVDVHFTEPGNLLEQGRTSGFGAVFTDVDLNNTTSLEFFDVFDNSLGVFYASTFDTGLSFLGVSFGSPVIARVRITSGNTALGPNDGGGIDVVALDDFIFGEPQRVPEPTLLLLTAAGLVAAAFRGRRRA